MNKTVKMIMVAAAAFITRSAAAQAINDDTLEKNHFPITNAMDYISKLNPIAYEFDQDKHKIIDLPAGPQLGLSTTEVLTVLPTIVHIENKWYQTGKNEPRGIAIRTVDLKQLIPVIIAAMQQQQAEIEYLKLKLLEASGKAGC